MRRSRPVRCSPPPWSRGCGPARPIPTMTGTSLSMTPTLTSSTRSSRGAAQTPQRWLYGAEGKILLARSPAGPAVISAPLPESLRTGLDNPHPGIRVGAVTESAIGSPAAIPLARRPHASASRTSPTATFPGSPPLRALSSTPGQRARPPALATPVPAPPARSRRYTWPAP